MTISIVGMIIMIIIMIIIINMAPSPRLRTSAAASRWRPV